MDIINIDTTGTTTNGNGSGNVIIDRRSGGQFGSFLLGALAFAGIDHVVRNLCGKPGTKTDETVKTATTAPDSTVTPPVPPAPITNNYYGTLPWIVNVWWPTSRIRRTWSSIPNRRRWLWALAALVALAVVAVLIWQILNGISQSDQLAAQAQQIATLKQQALTLHQQILSLHRQITADNGQISLLKQKLAAATGNIATLKAQITALQQQVASLTARLAGATCHMSTNVFTGRSAMFGACPSGATVVVNGATTTIVR